MDKVYTATARGLSLDELLHVDTRVSLEALRKVSEVTDVVLL